MYDIPAGDRANNKYTAFGLNGVENFVNFRTIPELAHEGAPYTEKVVLAICLIIDTIPHLLTS